MRGDVTFDYMNITPQEMALNAARSGDVDLFEAIFSAKQMSVDDLVFCEIRFVDFVRPVRPLTHYLLENDAFEMTEILLGAPYHFPLSVQAWVAEHHPGWHEANFCSHTDILADKEAWARESVVDAEKRFLKNKSHPQYQQRVDALAFWREKHSTYVRWLEVFREKEALLMVA